MPNERIQLVCVPIKKPPEFKNAFKIPPPKNHWIKIANLISQPEPHSYQLLDNGEWQQKADDGVIWAWYKPTFAWWFYEQELTYEVF